MSEVDKILIIGLAIFWELLAIAFFILMNKETPKEFRKFYAHPHISVAKYMEASGKFKRFEKIIVLFLSIIVYLPITLEWFIGWYCYKLVTYFTKYFDSSNFTADESEASVNDDIDTAVEAVDSSEIDVDDNVTVPTTSIEETDELAK